MLAVPRLPCRNLLSSETRTRTAIVGVNRSLPPQAGGGGVMSSIQYIGLPSVRTRRSGIVYKPSEHGVVHRVPDGEKHVAGIEMTVLNLLDKNVGTNRRHVKGVGGSGGTGIKRKQLEYYD